MTTVFFHSYLWKKQRPNACFNLFLVLLLSPESVAVYVIAATKTFWPDLIFYDAQMRLF
jgi:hypothetical protein